MQELYKENQSLNRQQAGLNAEVWHQLWHIGAGICRSCAPETEAQVNTTVLLSAQIRTLKETVNALSDDLRSKKLKVEESKQEAHRLRHQIVEVCTCSACSLRTACMAMSYACARSRALFVGDRVVFVEWARDLGRGWKEGMGVAKTSLTDAKYQHLEERVVLAEPREASGSARGNGRGARP